MKKFFLIFTMGAIAVTAHAQKKGSEVPQEVPRPVQGQPYGAAPDYKPRRIAPNAQMPFQKKDTPGGQGAAANSKKPEGKEGQTVDVRQVLAGRTITGISFGLVPMVIIDGETFAVGDYIEFSDNKGAGSRLKLKKIQQVPDLKLIIEVTGMASAVTFEFEIPKELRDMF